MKKKKKQIVAEIIIDAPVEKIWGILTDFNQYSEWNPFIVKSRGVPVVGSTLVNTMKQGDKNMTLKPKIIKAITNRTLEWKGSLIIPGLFDGLHYFKIEQLSNNQSKLIQGELFSGILSGPILKSLKENTTQGFIEMNMALKKLAENNLILNRV